MPRFFNPDIGDKTYFETFTLSSTNSATAQPDELAAIEVNFNALFAAIHNEVTCPHYMALAQQQTDSNSTAQQPQAVGYENDDGTNDIDGTTAGDTGDANLEPLRSGNVWNIIAGGTLTYSYYDGVTPIPAPIMPVQAPPAPRHLYPITVLATRRP